MSPPDLAVFSDLEFVGGSELLEIYGSVIVWKLVKYLFLQGVIFLPCC